MEIRLWADRILSADTLEEKLFSPDVLTDEDTGPAIKWGLPSRPLGMHFSKHSRKDKLPKISELSNPDKRAICLHRFAGHELLAVEVMAYALLAFPKESKTFRKGLTITLKDEQRHVRLYLNQLKRFNMTLSDLPLYKHFWAYTPFLNNPQQYVSVMSLTFEMANLDFAPYYGHAFHFHGDQEASNLMKVILSDEIRHVRFGYTYLKRHSTKGSIFSHWLQSLPSIIHPSQSKGKVFQKENRQQAGIDEDWITQLSSL